jgi:nucleotide-binding universal stress UspA family protein
MEKAGHQAHKAVLSGEIDGALSQYAEDHDIHLMIMGAFGHSRIRQFFVGSTTTKVLHGVKIPLLILRSL